MRLEMNNHMLMYIQSSIFTSPAKVLVNTVNTVGVMGKGIALQYKKLYPEMFKKYQQYCEHNQFNVGQLMLYRTPNKWILNFPTKKDWRQKSKISYIESGLKKFVQTYEQKGITSIAFPQLGVGNGGLDWDKQVKPLMEKYLTGLPIKVFIHLYSQKTTNQEFQSIKETHKWLDSNPTSLSYFEVVNDLQSAIKHSENNFITPISNNSYSDDSKIFHVHHGKQNYYLTKYDILGSWNILRSTGLLIETDYPSIVAYNNDYRFYRELFSKLPYVSITEASYSNTLTDVLFLNKAALPFQDAKNAQTEKLVQRG